MSTDLIIGVTKAALILGLLLTNTILLIWLERKLVAGMQSRVGPDRAGPFGILQTVADAVNGAATLDTQFEAVSQAALADLIILSKTDIASPQLVKDFKSRIEKINP
ncbi:MAG: hypothetical protein CL495_00725, partial [Actinobacteria bacterium]|nr:hypothetical protein [Actinomycetota bacterium]